MHGHYPKVFVGEPPYELMGGGKDSSKLHTDGRINLELAVRITTSALGRPPASLG